MNSKRLRMCWSVGRVLRICSSFPSICIYVTFHHISEQASTLIATQTYYSFAAPHPMHRNHSCWPFRCHGNVMPAETFRTSVLASFRWDASFALPISQQYQPKFYSCCKWWRPEMGYSKWHNAYSRWQWWLAFWRSTSMTPKAKRSKQL